MRKHHYKEFGFDKKGIKARLALIGLSDDDLLLGEKLQDQVIIPGIDNIIDEFYRYMLSQPEMLLYLDTKSLIQKLKTTQKQYLLSLGVKFNSTGYFEERLRVGLAHAKVGIPPYLYICAYQRLRHFIYINCPEDVRKDDKLRDELYLFVNKITALDMSIAIETYHLTQLDKLESSIISLKQEEHHLRHLAETDRLTGLSNHAHIVSLLGDLITIVRKEGESLCVMMGDIDFFKKVNDTHGHLVGDGVLREIAARLQSALRDIDIIGRYGGEEFIVVFSDTTIETAYEVAERIRKRIADSPFNIQGIEIALTISLGLCTLDEDDDVSTIIAKADKALYMAKNSGRNCVKICNNDAAGN